MPVYLDHAATTPLDPAALEAMLPFLEREAANPSSIHRAGQRARAALETARERVAAAIGAKPSEIVFTSGATEADNHAVVGAMAERSGALVTAASEHAAVLAPAGALERAGREVHRLQPGRDGVVPLDALAAALERPTALVALMRINNETGVRSDIAAAAEIAHAAGAWVHCDAVQAFGFEALDVDRLGVDLMALSSHKIGGPTGVGALYLRSGTELPPLLLGGEQERSRRAGTHNLAAIVGFGVAAEVAAQRAVATADRVAALRDRLETAVLQVPGVAVNGAGAPRGPKHVNVSVDGVDGETLLMALDARDVYVSAGSACAAGSLEPSHVLLAMGLDATAARASLRFSFGATSTEAEVDAAASAFAEAVALGRAFAGTSPAATR